MHIASSVARAEQKKKEKKYLRIYLKEAAWTMPIPLRPSFAASWFQSLWRRGAADLSGGILVESESEGEAENGARLSPFTSRALASSPSI